MINTDYVRQFLLKNCDNFTKETTIDVAIYNQDRDVIEITGTRTSEIYIMGEQKKTETTVHFNICQKEFENFIKLKNTSIWDAHKSFTSGD